MLKARRTASKDQHLCHLHTLPLRQLARLTRILPNPRNRICCLHAADALRVPARARVDGGLTERVSMKPILAPEECPYLLSEFLLGERLGQERRTRLEQTAMEDFRGES
jgi:hypothetical protein